MSESKDESRKWRSEKVRCPRPVAELFARQLATELEAQNPGIEYHFGGSYRREADTIGDLDVVVVTPNGTFLPDLEGAPGVQLPAGVEYQRRGDKIAQGDAVLVDNGNKRTMHVDFWTCSPKERGAFLWFITGPKELNVAMRKAAIRKGLNLSQVGLLRDGEQLDDGTEAGVVDLLGEEWRPLLDPGKRQQWLHELGKPEPTASERRVQVEGSKPGTFYQVSVNSHGEPFRCTCKGYQYRGECKHLRQVEEFL